VERVLASAAERHGSGAGIVSAGSTIPRSAANSASSASLRYSPSSDGASTSALSDQEADAQDALAHEAADCASLAQEAEAQEAEAQEALAQLAWFQDAEAQEASDQEALAQDALAEAVLAQLAALKILPPETSVVTNLFSAAFGFGALESATAFATSTTPTPAESGAESPAGRAVTISAPLT
jgi:hypothetical protein